MAQVFSDLSDPRPFAAGDATVRARASREQRRLWFLAAKHPGETTYHMAYRLDLRGAIDAARLRRAIAMLQDRHETLRTRFEFDGETLFQCVETTAVARFEVIDAPGDTPVQREAAMNELAEEFAAEPIPLDRAPLFRCRLIQWDDDRAALIFVMHHIIGDGWSHSVLTRDFCQAYLFAGRTRRPRRQPAARGRRAPGAALGKSACRVCAAPLAHPSRRAASDAGTASTVAT